MYNKQQANLPMHDAYAGEETVAVDNGYGSRIICEIQELQALAEALHSKCSELTGTCQETAVDAGADVKQRDPQNFCEQTIRDLKRVRRVMCESLDSMGKF